MALIPEKTARARILHCTEPARAAGVAPGMTPSQAQARCPELIVRLQSPLAESCARAALLDGAGAFSPWVEETASGVCTLELKGDREAPPGELGPALLSRLARLGLRVQAGFAPRADLALLAAQSRE